MDLLIPNNLKHYDFKKVIVQNMVDNYDEFIEECRVKDLHSKFLIKYELNKHINWYF